MTFEAKCKIEDQVIAMFNKAIVNPDNLDISEVDGINWNFVDSDIHIGVKEAGIELFFDLDDFIESMISEYLEFGQVETNSIAA
jgi:hypothetical protein|tara:strand:- start:181 stop:432 length:252 start_codon:yes stop_codon:yes gene_type:complete